jgi:hypothetical protein
MCDAVTLIANGIPEACSKGLSAAARGLLLRIEGLAYAVGARVWAR